MGNVIPPPLRCIVVLVRNRILNDKNTLQFWLHFHFLQLTWPSILQWPESPLPRSSAMPSSFLPQFPDNSTGWPSSLPTISSDPYLLPLPLISGNFTKALLSTTFGEPLSLRSHPQPSISLVHDLQWPSIYDFTPQPPMILSPPTTPTWPTTSDEHRLDLLARRLLALVTMLWSSVAL